MIKYIIAYKFVNIIKQKNKRSKYKREKKGRKNKNFLTF